MSDAAGRERARAVNTARHLDAQHPGTVLLLARYAPGGRPDATAATLEAVDDAGLQVAVTTPAEVLPLRLALPPGADVRGRVADLLRAVRAGLPDDGSVPLTSLEQQLAGHGPHPHRGPGRGAAPDGGAGPGSVP